MRLLIVNDMVEFAGPLLARLAEQRAARLRREPIDARARGEEEDATVFTPREVRGELWRDDATEERAVRAAHPDTPGTRAEHVAVHVDLHAVGHARVVGGHVEQDAASRQRAVGPHGEG